MQSLMSETVALLQVLRKYGNANVWLEFTKVSAPGMIRIRLAVQMRKDGLTGWFGGGLMVWWWAAV